MALHPAPIALPSPSKSFLSTKSFNLLLVSSRSLRPATYFVHAKCRRRRMTVAATATLDSANGSVRVAQEDVDDQAAAAAAAAANPYGRQFFPLAAVVGQVSTPL